MQTAVGNTTGYVNYVYNLQAKGTAQVASQIMGMSGLVGSTLGQLAFQTSAYLSEAESVAMSFGVVATAGLYKATKQAMEFDYAMQGVQAIAGQNNIGNLGDQAMAMSNKFGVAIDQMVEGLESLARAGVSPSNMQGILEQAMGLSKLESIDLNTAINSLISTTNLLDTQGLDLESPEYVDAIKYQNQKITATSEAAPINAQDIIHTLEHVGGYASSTNLDQDDLYAVIAQLGSKGTKSEMAGTSLRAFLAAGQKDTAQRALDRIGLSVNDLWKNDEQILSISDMKDVLDEAMDAKGYTKQEKLEFYSDFAGYKQANQIMKIDTKSVREFKEKIDRSWDVGKKIDTILQTTQANLQSILQTGTNLVTSVGQPLMQVANVILTPLKMIMGAIDFVVTKVPGMKWVAAGTLMMVALKGLSTVFNKVAPSVALMLDGFTGVRNYAQDTRDALSESAMLIKLIAATHNPFTSADDKNKKFARGQLVGKEKDRILSKITDEDYLHYFIKYKKLQKGDSSQRALMDLVNLRKSGMNPVERKKMEDQIKADKQKQFKETGALYTEDKKSQTEILEEKNKILEELKTEVYGANTRLNNLLTAFKNEHETKANSDGPNKIEKGIREIKEDLNTGIDYFVDVFEDYQGDILSDTNKIVSSLSSLTDNIYTVRLASDSVIRFDSDNNINFDLDLSTINTTLEKGFADIISAIQNKTSGNTSNNTISNTLKSPKIIKTKTGATSIRTQSSSEHIQFLEEPVQDSLNAVENPKHFYVPKKGHGDALIKRLQKAKGKKQTEIRKKISVRVKKMKELAKEIERQDENDNLLGATLQEYWEIRNEVFGDSTDYVEYGTVDKNGIYFKELTRNIDKKVRNTYGNNKIVATKDKKLLKETANVQVKVKVVSSPDAWDTPDISNFTANNDLQNDVNAWADYFNQQQNLEDKYIEKNIPIKPNYILPKFNGPKISEIAHLKTDRTTALSKITKWLEKVDKDLQTMKNQFEDEADYEKFVAEQYHRALKEVDAYNVTSFAEAGFLSEEPGDISSHRLGTVYDYINKFYKLQDTVRKSGRFNEHDPRQMIFGAERFGAIRNKGKEGAAQFIAPVEVTYTNEDLGTYDEYEYTANNYETTNGVIQNPNQPKFMRIVYDNEPRTVGNYNYTRANDMNADYGAMDIIPEPMFIQVAEGTDDTVYTLAQNFQDKLTFYQQLGKETRLPVGPDGKILTKEQIQARIKHLENKVETKTVKMADLIDKNAQPPIKKTQIEQMVDEDFSKQFILDFTSTLLDSNFNPLTKVKIVNTNGEDEIIDTRMDENSSISIHNQFKKLLVGSPQYMEAVSNKMNDFLNDNDVRNLLKTGEDAGDSNVLAVLKHIDGIDQSMITKDLLSTVYNLYRAGVLNDDLSHTVHSRAFDKYQKDRNNRIKQEELIHQSFHEGYEYGQDENVEENAMVDVYPAEYLQRGFEYDDEEEYFQDPSYRMKTGKLAVDDTILDGIGDSSTVVRVNKFTGALTDSLRAMPDTTKVDMVHQEAVYGDEMSYFAEQIAELDRQHKMIVEMEGMVEKGQIAGITSISEVTDKHIKAVYGNLIKSPWSTQHVTPGTVEGKNQNFGYAEDVLTSMQDAQAVYDSFNNRTDVLKSFEGIHRNDINDDTNYLPNVVRKRSLESIQRSSKLPDLINAAKATPGAGGEEEGWRRMFMETEHGIVSYIDKNEMSVEVPEGKVHPDKLKPADQIRVANTYLGEQAAKYLKINYSIDKALINRAKLFAQYEEKEINIAELTEEMERFDKEYAKLIEQRDNLSETVFQHTSGAFDFSDRTSNDLERALDLGEGRGVEVLPEVFVRTAGRYFEKHNGDPFIRDKDGNIVGIERDANNRFSEIWTKELEKKRYSERLKSKNRLNAGYLAGNFGITQKDITEIQLPERALDRIKADFDEQAFLGIDYKRYEDDEDYRKEIDNMYKRMNIMNYKPVGAPKDAKPNKNLFKKRVTRQELRALQANNLLMPQDVARYITKDNQLQNADKVDGKFEVFDLSLLQYSQQDMENATTMELISKDLMLQRDLATIYDDRNPYTNELYKNLTLDDVFAVDYTNKKIRTTNKVSPFIAEVMNKGMFAQEGGFALKKFLDKGGNEDRFLANMVNNLDLTENLHNASLKRMEEIKEKREKFLAGVQLAQNKLYHGQILNNDDIFFLGNMDVMQNVFETEMGIEKELQEKFNYIRDLAFIREQYANDPKYIQQLEEAGILHNYSGYENIQDYIEKTSNTHEREVQHQTVANNPLEQEKSKLDTVVSSQIWKDFDKFLLETGSFENGFGSMFFNEKHFRNLTSLDAFKDFMINEKMHYNRREYEEDPEMAIKEFFAENSEDMHQMLLSVFQVYAQKDTSWQKYMNFDEYFDLWLQQHDDVFEQLFFIYQHYNEMQHIYDQTGMAPDMIVKNAQNEIANEAEQEKWRYSTFVSSYKPQTGNDHGPEDEDSLKDTHKVLKELGITSEDLFNNAQSLPGLGLIYTYGTFASHKLSESKYKANGKNGSVGDLKLKKESDIWYTETEDGKKPFDEDRRQYLETLDEIARLQKEYFDVQRAYVDKEKEFLILDEISSIQKEYFDKTGKEMNLLDAKKAASKQKAEFIKARIQTLQNSIEAINIMEEEENKEEEQGSKSFGEISADILQNKANQIKDAQSRINDITSNTPWKPGKTYTYRDMIEEKIKHTEKNKQISFINTLDEGYLKEQLAIEKELKYLEKNAPKKAGTDEIAPEWATLIDAAKHRLSELKTYAAGSAISDATKQRDQIIDEYFSESWNDVVLNTLEEHRSVYGDLEKSNLKLFNKEVMAKAQKTFMDNTLNGLNALEKITPFLEDFNPMDYLKTQFGDNFFDYVAIERNIMSKDQFQYAKQGHTAAAGILQQYPSYEKYLEENKLSDFEKARHGLYDIGQHERSRRKKGGSVDDGSSNRVDVIFDDEEIKETQAPKNNTTTNSYKNTTYLGRSIYVNGKSSTTTDTRTVEEKLNDEIEAKKGETYEYKKIEESLKEYKRVLDAFFINATKEIFGQYKDDTFQLSELFNGIQYNIQSEKLENASTSLDKNINYLNRWRDALDTIGKDFSILRAPIDIVTMALTPILATLQTGKSVTNLLLSITKHAKKLNQIGKTEINGREILAESGSGQIIGAIGGLIGPIGNKVDDFILKNIAPILPELAAIGIGIYGIKTALDLSYKSHKKYLEQLQEEDKQNRSRSKSLQALTKQSKERVEQNKTERQQDSLNRQYLRNKQRLDNANLTRTTGAITLTRAQNDPLWGQYGISASLEKIQGQYESTAANYDGSTGQIRRIKESTLGGQGLVRGLPGYFSPAQEQVAAYYDANQLALGRLDEYIDELGQLYDAETTAMLKYKTSDIRGTPEFQRALNDFVEATGITRDHAEKYLDYMQTEHNVDKASQAMQAQADTIASNTEFKIQAIAFGGNPADVLGLNGVEAQQNAMIQAQADLIQLELSSQLWWKAVWSTITSPIRAIISPVFAIAHTLSAIWSVITGNWDAAGRHMQQAGASLNVLGETTTYWGAWGEVESTDFNAIGQEAVDNRNRANYGNVGTAPKTGYVNAKNPESNAIFGMFPVGPKGGVHWGKEHKETLAQTKQESFFSKLIGTVTGLLGTIVSILTIGAVGLGLKTLWDHSDTLKNWVGKITNYFPNIKSTIEKIPGAGTIGKYGGKFIDYLKGTRMGQFISDKIPDSWKDKWQIFKDLWNVGKEEVTEEETDTDKSIEENISNVNTYVKYIYELLKGKYSSSFLTNINTPNNNIPEDTKTPSKPSKLLPKPPKLLPEFIETQSEGSMKYNAFHHEFDEDLYNDFKSGRKGSLTAPSSERAYREGYVLNYKIKKEDPERYQAIKEDAKIIPTVNNMSDQLQRFLLHGNFEFDDRLMGDKRNDILGESFSAIRQIAFTNRLIKRSSNFDADSFQNTLWHEMTHTLLQHGERVDKKMQIGDNDIVYKDKDYAYETRASEVEANLGALLTQFKIMGINTNAKDLFNNASMYRDQYKDQLSPTLYLYTKRLAEYVENFKTERPEDISGFSFDMLDTLSDVFIQNKDVVMQKLRAEAQINPSFNDLFDNPNDSGMYSMDPFIEDKIKLAKYLYGIEESPLSAKERGNKYDDFADTYHNGYAMEGTLTREQQMAYHEYLIGSEPFKDYVFGKVNGSDIYENFHMIDGKGVDYTTTYRDMFENLMSLINSSKGLWENSVLYHGGVQLPTEQGSYIGSTEKITSTTFTPQTAQHFKEKYGKDGYLTKIYAPGGTKGLYTNVLGEDEFTLGKDQKFVELSRDDKNRTAEILILTPTLMSELGLTDEMIDQAIGDGFNFKEILGLSTDSDDIKRDHGGLLNLYPDILPPMTGRAFKKKFPYGYLGDQYTTLQAEGENFTLTSKAAIYLNKALENVRGEDAESFTYEDQYGNKTIAVDSMQELKDILEELQLLIDEDELLTKIIEEQSDDPKLFIEKMKEEMRELYGVNDKSKEKSMYPYYAPYIPPMQSPVANPPMIIPQSSLPVPTSQNLPLAPTTEETISNGIETLPFASLMPADTKKTWSGYLSEKVHNFTDPWSNYLTQKKNNLLGISNDDLETFNKKKRKGMNKDEREYLNEKYDLGFDLDEFRTSKQANKAIRNKLDETGQWDTAVQDLHGGGLYRHQIKKTIKNNYVEPWKKYGKNKMSQWMTEAELYNQNPTYMGKQIYDTKNAPLPVKMIAKGYEIKDKIASKIGLGNTGSLGDLKEAIQDPEKMEEYLKERLDSFDSDSTIGQYRDKAYRAKEIISDPEKTMEWIQGKYYNGFDKGREEYEWYNQGAVSYGDLSIPNKIRNMKEQVLGMSGDESFADLLQNPERTVEVAKRGYAAFQENGLNGLLGADDDYDIAGSVKNKVSELFGKIKEGAEEGIDDEDGGEGGAGGLIQKAKEKLAGIFDKDTSPITKEEMEEKEKEGNFQTVSDWKKQKLEEIQQPSLSDRIKSKLGFDTDEEEPTSLSDWKKEKTEEAQVNKKESLSNRISNKMKNIFGSEEAPMSRIGRMTTLPEGQSPMSEMVSKVVSPGAAEETPSILDLDDTGELLSGKNISKGGKTLSKLGGKLAGKGGKLGKLGKGMSKIGGGLSKAGSKGLGGVAKSGLGKLGKSGIGKAGSKAIGKIGSKVMGKVGGKIAGKVGAQVASKVLGAGLMATGIGAPLGLLMESPIGGMLMEGVFNLGGSLLGGAGKAVSRGARGLGRALGFGRSLPGEHGGGGGIGGMIGGALAASPLGMLAGGIGSIFGGGKGGGPVGGVMGAVGGLAAGAGNMMKGLFGGGSKNQGKTGLDFSKMSKSLKNIDKTSDVTAQHNEKIDKATGNILGKISKTNSQNSSGGNITIQNININTADDPEAIKEMFLELLIELQEQVNPRLVSRTAGQAPDNSTSNTDTNADTNTETDANTSTSDKVNNSSIGGNVATTNNNTNS